MATLRGSALADRWEREDHARALLPSDHAAVKAARPVRECIGELLYVSLDGGPGALAPQRDLLHALAAYGRLLARQDASPTLAALTIDALLAALGADERHAATLGSTMRGALAEAYARALVDARAEEAARRWDFPACAVAIDRTTIAISAGYPEQDSDGLSAWASRVAHGASLGGFRRAIVAGSPRAVGALDEALDLAGIERVAPYRKPK